MSGSRTNIAEAIRDNLIREVAPGVYEEVKSAAGTQRTLQDVQAEQQAAEQQQQTEQAEYIDAEEEDLWQQDIDPLPQVAYDVASASAMEAILRGDSFEDSAKGLAHNANISPELAAEYISEGYAKGRRTVDRALSSLGLTGDRLEQFYEAT